MLPMHLKHFSFTNHVFLQRQIAKVNGNPPTTVKPPDFANKIIELALNRTGKGTAFFDEKPQKDISVNTISANSVEKPTLSKTEIERGKQDIETINSDLQLLSSLLGRPVSAKDLPTITQQFGGGSGGGVRGTQRRKPDTTTSTTTTTTTTTSKPAILREVELLQTILKTQQNNVKPEQPPEYYGKTDDAILATILKQQGIGPTHNNIPIEVSYLLPLPSFFLN